MEECLLLWQAAACILPTSLSAAFDMLLFLSAICAQDGREYVTPDQVERELRDEIIVHGGRVALTTVQQAINVDLRHVQNRYLGMSAVCDAGW